MSPAVVRIEVCLSHYFLQTVSFFCMKNKYFIFPPKLQTCKWRELSLDMIVPSCAMQGVREVHWSYLNNRIQDTPAPGSSDKNSLSNDRPPRPLIYVGRHFSLAVFN